MHEVVPLSFGRSLRRLETPGLCLVETLHPRGLATPFHEHEHACLNFVLDGCYREDLGRGLGAFGPQWVGFRPAGERHRNDFREGWARALLVELRSPELAPEHPLGGPSWTRDPAAAALGLRIWHELAGPDELSPLSIEEWSLALFERAARANETAGLGSARVRRVEELLHAGWRDPWTLTRLAAAVGLHPSHLARAFHALHGCTIGEYLRRLRVNEVARRLVLGDEPISFLALEAGFADQSHCTRAFHRQLGLTPAAYRRAFRR
jgi:AraC family transcriptional regulator